jgi:hypothetical protein
MKNALTDYWKSEKEEINKKEDTTECNYCGVGI